MKYAVVKFVNPEHHLSKFLEDLHNEVGDVVQTLKYEYATPSEATLMPQEVQIQPDVKQMRSAVVVAVFLVKLKKSEEEIKKDLEKKNLMSEDQFKKFWKAYPNKKGKANARKKFMKLDASLFEKIMESLEAHKKSDQWLSDNGKYIPHGSTWVNGQAWEDEGLEEPAQLGEEDYYEE